MMTMTLWKPLLRQSAYALAFFVVIALGMEFFMPGSVTPFLDPLPFAFLALILLGADAMGRPVETRRRWLRIAAACLVLFAVAGLVIASTRSAGSTDRLALVVILLSTIVVLGAFANKRPSLARNDKIPEKTLD